MALGGKGYSLGSRREGRRFGLGTLIGLLILAAAIWFGYQKYIGMTQNKAAELLAAGDYENAEHFYKKAAGLPLANGRGHGGLGALELLRGNIEEARSHFRIVLEKKPSGGSENIDALLDAFIDQGRYDSARIYGDFLKEWKSESALEPYALKFAAVCLGARDLAGAKAQLALASPALQRTARYGALSEAVARFEKEGAAPVLLDRDGKPLLSYNVKTESYDFVSPRIFAGWIPESGVSAMLNAMDPVDRQNRIKTTIDLDLQHAAARAMQGYNGAMILLDPKSGDILAAFGNEGYNPFSYLFEPGSVMKVYTYGLFLEDGASLEGYAPKEYDSGMRIDGKIFYDWTRQGQLNSVEEGMAVSCNLMFAQMGMEMSWPGLGKGFKRLFDGEELPGYWGPGVFGKILKEPENNWDLANVSIGLEQIRTSVLGIAVIPAAVANGGVVNKPRLFDAFMNVEGKVYKTAEPESMGRLFKERTAQKLTDSLIESVTNERGTARRAQVDFVNAGMKTGTSGSRPFNSVMIGSFPIENPKISFALFLHNGGKCEINGTKVAKRLQENVREVAPEYLEK